MPSVASFSALSYIGAMKASYDFLAIEKKWREYWNQHRCFKTLNPGDPGFDASKPKYYVLDMFPYPSGKGLHVGHPLGYIATDIVARYKRMLGFNVLHPMGFDAFGLPAEQYAIETGTHPEVTTQKNIENMISQLKACGLSYDWDRMISTTEPEYYRWTQWIFLQLFESYFDPKKQKALSISQLRKFLRNDEYRVSDGQLCSDREAAFSELPLFSSLRLEQQEEEINRQRLAYIDAVNVNWCPGLGTVLANEEVTVDGRSERGNFPVFQRPLQQWMLRITTYADRLIKDLDLVEWPEAVKQMQKNWIGRSEGASLSFPLYEIKGELEVYTTRPDTLYGATFMAVSPEHPMLSTMVTSEQKPHVDAFMKRYQKQKAVSKDPTNKEKEGVWTGAYCIHPLTQKKIPVWISDYVLMGYGTGAIMAVPAHDQRDFEFAKKYNIPMQTVVMPPQEWLAQHRIDKESYVASPETLSEAFVEYGHACHSQGSGIDLDGQPTNEAKKNMIAYLEAQGLGISKVSYKLRDWLFSRQRYWGEPFPILHGAHGKLRAVDEADLPVTLPPLKDFRPQVLEDQNQDPVPSLGKAEESWKRVEIEDQRYQRELNTMPQWAGSCWYYLRFMDPHNQESFVSSEIEKYWMGENGVDLYVGGVEHAVLHLLYARFWHKVLYDLGKVSTKEPFGKLFNQGYIQAYSYQDERGMYVPADEVEHQAAEFMFEGKSVQRQLGKMGKSLKNSIAPDEVIEKYGCDTFRLYEMYLGPVEQSKVWDTEAIVGIHRFLGRLWRNFVDSESGDILVSVEESTGKLKTALHHTIKTVTEYMDQMRYNAAIAQLISLNNLLVEQSHVPSDIARAMLLMLSPMAPHICEELWARMGQAKSLHDEAWPKAREEFLKSDVMELVVQVNGKRRANIEVAADAKKEEIEKLACEHEAVKKHLADKNIAKVIYVPGRLVNIVVKG